ncbi:MAG TPA: pyrrolo-quinoline quinone [Lachnoclostridium phytofermentans]|uniref:Pyrrolo-quinoline quinone n=1 Tax=Lachnoclostridium phytofermentans TaxID=66219 RepID=A0A3D2X7F4_9FIRM|nr:PQQ-binding-like beta-propeller repeat protein [Lachnoclostridium sp.]HCL02657.1 pyrrolo-quinoline quinone [Lachnoclostridium phytofermentans]
MRNKKLVAMCCIGLLAISMSACSSKGKLTNLTYGEESAVEVFNPPNYSLEQKLLVSGKPTSSATTKQELFGFQSDLMVDDQIISDYKRDETIDFSGNYTDMEGVITFRGNNYRNSAVFGTANIVDKKFDRSKTWSIDTGKLKKTVAKGYWLGSCWTGQPLIVRWKDETRKAMNLYEDKKNKEGLVEVIYSTADGNIYFMDLDDGKPTRDKISLGFPIKGTGSLYPSEVPLYFAGAGDSMGEDCARTFVVDLIQGKVIYEYGYDDEFSLRTDNDKFHAYDSSPLIDVATDTIIQPGENGILYTMKLNTKYDGKSVSINPDKPVKWRYTTDRSREEENRYWLGMESSASIWKGFLYITDNCGDMFCIDLNTMEVVWVQDTLDDTNASPVLEESMEDGTAYIYISTSLHWTADEKHKGDIPLMKVNAATGEIVWKRSYPCETVSNVSGGVQATALLGDKKLSDLVYFVIARTGGKDSGKLVALNKYTGETVWSVDMTNYGWSSPIALYDKDGNGYVILCDSTGNMYMVDGLSGKLYDTINLGKIIEASPAAFENTIVVGTKGQKIYGITVK